MGQSIREVIYSLEEFFFKFSHSLYLWILVLYTALSVGFTDIPFFSLIPLDEFFDQLLTDR